MYPIKKEQLGMSRQKIIYPNERVKFTITRCTRLTLVMHSDQITLLTKLIINFIFSDRLPGSRRRKLFQMRSGRGWSGLNKAQCGADWTKNGHQKVLQPNLLVWLSASQQPHVPAVLPRAQAWSPPLTEAAGCSPIDMLANIRPIQ